VDLPSPRTSAPGEESAAPLVDIRNLTKIYEPSPAWLSFLLRSAIREPVVALDDVTFSVAPGQICAVVGPNGAGKSTLFRVLTGLTTATSGTARIAGLDCTDQSVEVRRLIGFMPPDDRTLFLRYDCDENLLFHGRMQGMGERRLRRRIDEVLEIVGISHARTRAGFALSSGMRARLQLARALLHRPRVLILDEPTGTVDPIAAHEFLEILETTAAEEGVATLISSHRLEEIESLDDNLVMIDQGRIAYAGDLDELRKIWEQPVVELTFGGPKQALLASQRLVRPGIELLRIEGATIAVATALSTGAVLSALGDLVPELTDLTQQRMPLRELLLLAYQRAPKASRSRPDIEVIPSVPEHAGEVVSKAC
jgi:ABC-2 type transport system ATP-binding protein